MTVFFYILLGLLAGIFGGAFGIGGGTIMVPLLVLWFGLTQHQAQQRLQCDHGRSDNISRLFVAEDRARHLYDDRVPPAVRARRDYFDEELVQTLADGNPSLLGRPSDALA